MRETQEAFERGVVFKIEFISGNGLKNSDIQGVYRWCDKEGVTVGMRILCE